MASIFLYLYIMHIYIFWKGIVNKVGVFIFETMKPTIWNEVEAKLTEVMNSESRDIPHQFPTSINPVDQILAHVRYAKNEYRKNN